MSIFHSSLIFFLFRFLLQILTIHRTLGEWRALFLYCSKIFTLLRIFRHLFVVLHLSWHISIFWLSWVRAYNYQTFTWSDISRSSHWRCSIKKVFLEVSQNSQENTCARVSFLIKLQASLWYLKRFYEGLCQCCPHIETSQLICIAKHWICLQIEDHLITTKWTD